MMAISWALQKWRVIQEQPGSRITVMAAIRQSESEDSLALTVESNATLSYGTQWYGDSS